MVYIFQEQAPFRPKTSKTMRKDCFSALFIISPADLNTVKLFNGSICPGQYIVVDSYDAAEHAVHEECFDFIVVDLDVCDSARLNKVIKNANHASIILLSSAQKIQDAIHALKAGASNWLLKDELSKETVAGVVNTEKAKYHTRQSFSNISSLLSSALA